MLAITSESKKKPFRGYGNTQFLYAITYVIITVIRNIVEPKIVGAQLGLHPVVTLIAMFVGINVFGFFGIFGLPILLSLINHLNKKGIIHIFK